MKTETSKAGMPITCTKWGDTRRVWQIILLSLAPLAILAITGAVILVLVTLVRHLIDPASFLLEQRIFIIVMIAGLATAIIAYTIAVIYALKKIGTLRKSGYIAQANAGLITLTIVASLMILPVILALFFH
jgi:hypothetical protein